MTLIGIALFITVNARRGRHYLVPHGPLVQNQGHYPQVLEEVIQYARQHAQEDGAVALRIAPLVEENSAAAKLFLQSAFRAAPLHIHAERTWLLDITPDEGTLLAGMRKTTRHAITKAEKAGVTWEIVADPTEALDRFWPLYEHTRQRHGFVLWPKSALAAQLAEFGKQGKIFSVFARHTNKDMAAAILPHFDPTYASNAERLEFLARLVAPLTPREALFGAGLGDVTAQNLRETDITTFDVTSGAARVVQLAKDATLVDNQHLKTFIEMGLAGLLIYFWLYWRVARHSWSLVNGQLSLVSCAIGLWSLGFLAAFIIQGFFIDIWDIFPTNLLFWLVAALVSREQVKTLA